MQSEQVSADRMRLRMRSLLTQMRGEVVAVQLADGSLFEGVLHGLDPTEGGVVLRMAQAKRAPGGGLPERRFLKELKAALARVVSVVVVGGEFVLRGRSGFQTDTQISGRGAQPGKPRRLKRWTSEEADDEGVDLGALRNKGAWDQFKTNERITGQKSDAFRIDDYSTELDKGSAFYRKHQAEAARLAAQIEGRKPRNDPAAHLTDAQRFSNVARPKKEAAAGKSAAGKYRIPVRRAEQGAGTGSKAGDKDATTSQAPKSSATGGKPSSGAPKTGDAKTAEAKVSSSKKGESKSKLNPNAKAFVPNPNAKPFVPKFGAKRAVPAQPIRSALPPGVPPHGRMPTQGQVPIVMMPPGNMYAYANGMIPRQGGLPAMSRVVYPGVVSPLQMQQQQRAAFAAMQRRMSAQPGPRPGQLGAAGGRSFPQQGAGLGINGRSRVQQPRGTVLRTQQQQQQQQQQ